MMQLYNFSAGHAGNLFWAIETPQFVALPFVTFLPVLQWEILVGSI